MSNHVQELLSRLSLLQQTEQERLKTEIDRGTHFNIFSALNLCYDEVRLHSRLLATLLNPNATHGLGNQFLKLFLAHIGLPEDYITCCNESIVERSIGELTDISGGRIDIILEDGKHALIIENKIYAEDQPNQLLRYHNYGKERFGASNFHIVYLTLYGSNPSDKSLGGKTFDFSTISYATDILELLHKVLPTEGLKPVHYTIKDYITTLNRLTYQDMDTKYQNDVINTAIEHIGATSELLQLSKKIGDKLIANEIITPLEQMGFETQTEDNGALWMRSEHYTIIIKTDDRTFWRKVWIGVSPSTQNKVKHNLKCFSGAPTETYPYGWSWVSDDEYNNWHNVTEYPSIKDGSILRWLQNKIAEIQECFDEYLNTQTAL